MRLASTRVKVGYGVRVVNPKQAHDFAKASATLWMNVARCAAARKLVDIA
jgi:hypothetical protein